MYTQNIFINREHHVQEFVEDESIVFLDRAATVKDKFIRTFFAETICGTVGDAYDYFIYLNHPHNIFYKNTRQLERGVGENLYRLTAMYNTIRYIYGCCPNPKPFVTALFDVFLYAETDEADFFDFSDMILYSRPAFEMEFSRYAAGKLFHTQYKTPVSLVFVNNFFYNAYMGLITCQSVSQRRSKRPSMRETAIF